METLEFPTTNFDLIVIGTGLPESIIAAAACEIGKTVIQIDPNPFYASHYSSLTLSQLTSFLQSQSQSQSPVENHDDFRLMHRPLYEIISHSQSPELDDNNSREFNVDLSGPRVFLYADSMVEFIRRTRIYEYMEFQSVDASFVSDAEGNLMKVPDSQKDCFRNSDLKLTDKCLLTKILKIVVSHFDENDEYRISEQHLKRPFFEFLAYDDVGIILSHKLKSMLSHAIVLAYSDYEDITVDVISTKCAIDGLRLYYSSIGRFGNAHGAMMYPRYGQGELPQAFCRRAAVKGCIQVLRMPITAVIMGEGGGTYRGVKLASGQELYSTQLVLAPSFTVAPKVAHSVQGCVNSNDEFLRNSQRKVARAICVTKNSIKPRVANCLVTFPPESLCPEQRRYVCALQLSSNASVAPHGMFVIYLSVVCDDATEGQHLLNAAINALFSMPVFTHDENKGANHLSAHTDAKPSLLWWTLYTQELPQDAHFDSIRYTPMPDEHLHHNGHLNAIAKLFKENIYPGEEFFPSRSSFDEQVGDISELQTNS